MKMNLKPPLISVKTAAAELSLPEHRLYARLQANLKKQDVIFQHSGRTFCIVRTTGRIALFPYGSDIDKIENAAAAVCLAKLLPCLCPDCAAAVNQIKDAYERD